jgi:hypothetical protein
MNEGETKSSRIFFRYPGVPAGIQIERAGDKIFVVFVISKYRKNYTNIITSNEIRGL